MLLYRVRVSDHGRVEIQIKHAAIEMTVMVTKSMNGHPVMKPAKCEANVPSLSIELHGGARFIYMCLFNSYILAAINAVGFIVCLRES